MKIRSHGWVQNPSSFSNLKKTVQVFDSESEHYKRLPSVVSSVVAFEDEKQNLISKLENKEESFSYEELVGGSRGIDGKPTNKRAQQVADSLLKITILPQNFKTTGKRYTDAWTSDGFLRWAVCLNFISFDRNTDVFTITEFGRNFSKTEENSPEEMSILREAFLAYPPATQVLNILEKNKGTFVDKFFIGSQLGFTGEKGFTTYGSGTMTGWLDTAESPEEFKKIKTDYEGTSDKYARMICGWLHKVKLVEKKETPIEHSYGRTGFQKYAINLRGSQLLKSSQGSSSNKQITKFLMWEFLATKASNANHIRTRRAEILKKLEHTKSWNVLVQHMNSLGFEEDEKILRKDIIGLNQFGIRIELVGNSINLLDKLVDFDIPKVNSTQTVTDSGIEKIKNQLILETDLPNKYYELIDIAHDGKRNRDFEIYTIDLFKEVYGLEAVLLGGGRKPDGVVFTDSYGIMIDTKAYSTGYSKDINQEDQMVRYIEDNQYRDKERNDNLWWNNFSSVIPKSNFHFLWVSSKFVGQFADQLSSTSKRTSITGGALNVEQLLIGADMCNKEKLSILNLPNYLTNTEIVFKEVK